MDLLNLIDQEARRYDPRITKVMASLNTEHKMMLVATTEGLRAGDVQPLSRLQVTCIAEEGNNRQVGTFGGGGRVGFSFYHEQDRARSYAREAARQAILNLNAVDAPAGILPVVLASGWPGILLHEAVGHGLEADFNRKKTSAFSNLLGQRVASDVCTIVDDGTLPFRRGSLNIDDEGTPTTRTVLIEEGILCGYITDRLNARLMGIPLTGNGRREDFRSIVMPRMTNTFMLAGTSEPEDILRSVKKGLYAVSFGGGQVDITNGKFVFLGERSLSHRGWESDETGQRGDAHRERARRPQAGVHGGSRFAIGFGYRDLRKRRPIRSGRRRAADDSNR